MIPHSLRFMLLFMFTATFSFVCAMDDPGGLGAAGIPLPIVIGARRQRALNSVIGKHLGEAGAIEEVLRRLYGSPDNCRRKINGKWECTLPDCQGACNKREVKKNNVTRHIGVVLGVFPFQCPDCQMLFKQKKNLRYHQATRENCIPIQQQNQNVGGGDQIEHN